MDVREQRVQFVVAATRRERSLSALCAEFHISRPTANLWLRRYREEGLAGIAERSRRPQHSPRLHTSPELEEQVVALRQRYPDWGARKLQVLLAREGVPLTRSTIHRILLRWDLVYPADRHDQATGRFERTTPNELWQMDFKSPIGWQAPTGPLSVIDDHSRYLIRLQQTGSTRAELVQEQLQIAFTENGVPEDMLMDHGIPWWSSTSATGATELSFMADQAGHSAALERDTASANARQSGTLSWRDGAGTAAARLAGQIAAAMGWTSFAGSTTRCIRTRHCRCGRQPVCGGRVSEHTWHNRHAGVSPQAPTCDGWTQTAS